MIAQAYNKLKGNMALTHTVASLAHSSTLPYNYDTCIVYNVIIQLP